MAGPATVGGCGGGVVLGMPPLKPLTAPLFSSISGGVAGLDVALGIIGGSALKFELPTPRAIFSESICVSDSWFCRCAYEEERKFLAGGRRK